MAAGMFITGDSSVQVGYDGSNIPFHAPSMRKMGTSRPSELPLRQIIGPLGKGKSSDAKNSQMTVINEHFDVSRATGGPPMKSQFSQKTSVSRRRPCGGQASNQGFTGVVDGHFKSSFKTLDAAEASGRKLKSTYPMLKIEIYDAAKMVRTLLS
jgi:hypothetical protein